MKKICLILMLSFLLIIKFRTKVHAQSFELQQLILNIEKLNQLKSILNELYKGYQILSTGYNTIKDLSEGNFSLHKTFLDALLTVSPTVRKYKRIVEIIALEQQLIQQCRKTLPAIAESRAFSEQELKYLEKVYDDLIDRSSKNLDELLMVITSGQLRMNDAERLEAIDRIYINIKDKQDFLRHFSKRASLLAIQRKKTTHDYQSIEQLLEIK